MEDIKSAIEIRALVIKVRDQYAAGDAKWYGDIQKSLNRLITDIDAVIQKAMEKQVNG